MDKLRKKVREHERSWHVLELLRAMPEMLEGETHKFLAAPDRAHSQFLQDVFVLAMSDFQEGGYFVEFGAYDGFFLSNSLLLEAESGCHGILAEPAGACHDALHQNRGCHIGPQGIWRDSGETVTFTERADVPLSGIAGTLSTQSRMRPRKGATSYMVETFSLNDLLESCPTPSHIDYMSIDTEGTEWKILQACDFDRWSFGTLTVERPHAPQRETIFSRLTAHGYKRVCETISGIDDWYVRA